jgi:hypothetical protein
LTLVAVLLGVCAGFAAVKLFGRYAASPNGSFRGHAFFATLIWYWPAALLSALALIAAGVLSGVFVQLAAEQVLDVSQEEAHHGVHPGVYRLIWIEALVGFSGMIVIYILGD